MNEFYKFHVVAITQSYVLLQNESTPSVVGEMVSLVTVIITQLTVQNSYSSDSLKIIILYRLLLLSIVVLFSCQIGKFIGLEVMAQLKR